MASMSRRRTQKARASDTFRPKFPIDPFAAATVREPWFIRPDSLPSAASQARRDVILVLGAPSPQDLDALLTSKHLANSLLIVASHEPPIIPHTALPTVRMLRLDGPLAIEQAGAVRFVNVLEWAERVARLWRKYGGYGTAELKEEDDGLDYLTPPSILRFRSTHSTPSSPRSSTTQLSADPRASISTLEFGRPGRPRSVSSRILGRTRQRSLPAADPSQRPFDGLINFLSSEVSDKALLKQTILVTTISRPFLVPSGSPPSERGRRKSIMGPKSSTSVYCPPTPPNHSRDSLTSVSPIPTKAHLIHALPAESRSLDSFARSKLVQGLEAFLLSFGSPTTLDFHGAGDDLTDRLQPYIMTARSLGRPFSTGTSATSTSPYGSCSSDCTLAELVLCGSLDGDDLPSHLQSDRTRALVTRVTPRALLTQASDVVLLVDDAPAVVVSQSDPGHMGSTPPKARRLPRQNSMASTASTPPSSAPVTPSSLRSTSPRSPLAKGDTITSLAGLPTPPDSEESGAENGAEDIAYSPRKQIPASPSANSSEDSSAVELRLKKMRWKFWNRANS
ncbi:uncharacterized protein PHACADRAFT_206855 [Phanerochaete carnosa HHB-10118-sp]|uniref:Uncharacterized protein n=1 Tax=Phanerochaete carnosa (strain HHB-10118-sp) TaxID=650164 RepID=K5X581_PHACS|nr:uncharacterized protein PHACADRAFT_206855 [Phanerochaete carnosa HHB-10118-sp]EKM58012.1 hypothetical protein PHACADRAFT_206855 [Phanerochaete carnosa HHB-10118-sp]